MQHPKEEEEMKKTLQQLITDTESGRVTAMAVVALVDGELVMDVRTEGAGTAELCPVIGAFRVAEKLLVEQAVKGCLSS